MADVAALRVRLRRAPIRRIPTLVLSGELDLRTPLEKARELALALPGTRLLVERGGASLTIRSARR